MNSFESARSHADTWAERLHPAWAALAVLFALQWPSEAHAAAPTQPVLELSVHKVVAAQNGQPEKRLAADAAAAGDTLEYEAVYRNGTAQTVRNARITLPIPGNGAEYLPGSATSLEPNAPNAPNAPTASHDGKRYAAMPLMRTVPGPDGKPVLQPAPAADYRYLRWDLGDLPAGATRTVRARVVLLPVGGAR